MVLALALDDLKPTYTKTMGVKVWWRYIESVGPYRIQQNLISQHYRALDGEDGRVYSSFDLETVRNYLKQLSR